MEAHLFVEIWQLRYRVEPLAVLIRGERQILLLPVHQGVRHQALRHLMRVRARPVRPSQKGRGGERHECDTDAKRMERC